MTPRWRSCTSATSTNRGRPTCPASRWTAKPNAAPFLNVVLFLTLLFTIGGTTIAASFAVRHFQQAGEIVATIVMTLLLFVFAEVTPKTFAIERTDRVALLVAPAVVFLGRILGPFAKALLVFANVLMPGKGLKEGPYITEQELRAMAEVASEEEVIEEGEKELIHSIFEFGDTLVREVMVPRPDLVAAPMNSSMRQVLDLVLRHGFSRIPVYRNTLDDIEGVVYAKDLLRHLHAGKENVSLDTIMREPFFVPETKKIDDLLREMQLRRVHIAL